MFHHLLFHLEANIYMNDARTTSPNFPPDFLAKQREKSQKSSKPCLIVFGFETDVIIIRKTDIPLLLLSLLCDNFFLFVHIANEFKTFHFCAHFNMFMLLFSIKTNKITNKLSSLFS